MKQIRRRRSSLDSLPSSSRRFRKASRTFPFAYSVNPPLYLLTAPFLRLIHRIYSLGDVSLSFWVTWTADYIGRRRMLALGSALMGGAGVSSASDHVQRL